MKNYIIFANASTFSDDVSVGGHTVINGNVGSNEDVFLQGNPVLNYPAQLNGSVYAGNDIKLGQDLTVGGAGGPVRELVGNATVNVGGGVDVYGNVYGAAVMLGNSSIIHKVGGVAGNVEHDGSYTPISATVEGTVSTPKTKSFTPISMPVASGFSSGGANQTVDPGLDFLAVPANVSYGALATSQQDQTIRLTSGNYYFTSMTTQGGFTLEIDLTSGNPVNIFVTGSITMAQQNTLKVKGAGTGGLFVPISGAPQFADMIYFETMAGFTMGGASNASHNIWGGIVYAQDSLSPSLNAITVGQYTEWYGRIYADNLINVADHGFWAVPEPAALSLLGLGGVVLVARRRR